MSFSLNKIMLIGNLGRDAETRYTTNNVAITNFTLATTHSYKDKDGNWKDDTTWHNCTGFNLSDFYKNGLKKGKKFYVEGRLSKRDYTDKDGIKRYSTDVITEKIIPLDPKESGYSSNSNSSNGAEQAPNFPDPGVNASHQYSQTEDDDLPF